MWMLMSNGNQLDWSKSGFVCDSHALLWEWSLAAAPICQQESASLR